MSRRALGAGDPVSLTFKMPVALDRRLRARATADGDRPLGAVIRDALTEYLDREDGMSKPWRSSQGYIMDES